jgi:Holliday junction resolvasome RuvABC endonuclease subunit
LTKKIRNTAFGAKMIMGLDVSTSRIGWAIIDEDGKYIDSDFFKTKPKTPLEERAGALELRPQQRL